MHVFILAFVTLLAACTSGPLDPAPSTTPTAGEDSPPEGERVRVDPGRRLDAMFEALAASDRSSSDDCVFVWGGLRGEHDLRRVVVDDGEHQLEGWVACDQAVLESVLPASSGIVLGFAGDSLVAAHASEPDVTIAFADFEPDERTSASYVVVLADGDDRMPTIGTALPALARVITVYRAAMMPI